MKAKLVSESLNRIYEKKNDKLVDISKTKNELEKSKSFKTADNIKEKISALRKIEKELEDKLQLHPGPIAKSKVQKELDVIREKIALWNKKL